MAVLTFKQKIHRKKRNKKINELLFLYCMLRNHCIKLHNRYYSLYKKHLDEGLLKAHLAKLKGLKKYDWLLKLASQTIQDVVERIKREYDVFFAKKKKGLKCKRPRMIKYKEYSSFTFKGHVGTKVEGNTITFGSKHYKLSFKFHRTYDEYKGKRKLVTIKKDGLGDFYICFIHEVESIETKVNPACDSIEGIDYGQKIFLTLSDGSTYKSPLRYKQNENKIKELCQQLAKAKGTKRHKYLKYSLARLYKRTACQRKDDLFQLASHLTKKYDMLCVEDLNLKELAKKYGKKTNDQAYASLLSILSYKTKVMQVEWHFPSSKLCSRCNHKKVDLTLEDRVYECRHCGLVMDRDLNASINIRNRGIFLYQQGKSPLGEDTKKQNRFKKNT